MDIITGQDINNVFPTNPTLLTLIAFPLLPVVAIGVVFWIILFAAIFYSKYYQDPNYLLVISLGMSDLLHAGSALYISISTLVYSSYNRGAISCFIETFLVIVSFAGSGLSVVMMSLDRYLQLCHGFEKSWRLTMGLQFVIWCVALVFPSLALFTSGLSLPDTMMLSAGLYCLPNFATGNVVYRTWLCIGLSLIFGAFFLVAFCYFNIFSMYVAKKRGKNRAWKLKMDPMSKKLLFKFAMITGSYFVFFAPLASVFIVMVATGRDASWQSIYTLALFYQLCPLTNPLLLYFLDARLYHSVNDLLHLKMSWLDQYWTPLMKKMTLVKKRLLTKTGINDEGRNAAAVKLDMFGTNGKSGSIPKSDKCSVLPNTFPALEKCVEVPFSFNDDQQCMREAVTRNDSHHEVDNTSTRRM
jgi:hypothetical protein